MHRPSHSPSPEQLKIFSEKYTLYALESTTLNNVVIRGKNKRWAFFIHIIRVIFWVSWLGAVLHELYGL